MQDRLSATVFLDTSDDCATSPYGQTNGVPGITLMLVTVLCWITLASLDSDVFAAEAPARIVNSDQSVSDADEAEEASLNQAEPEPSATEPSAPEPSATEPSATEPSAIEPSATEQAVSDEVRWKRAIDRDDVQVLRQLLSQVDVKLSNDKGKTALMAAAKTGDLDLLESLLQKGLTLDDRSFTGGTSLMYAALGRETGMISYLLDATRGAANFQSYVDAESTNGWTAVMIAAAKGFDGVVQQLVEEGQADAWRADAYQWSPLMRAIDNRHAAVIHYLLELDQPLLSSVNENGATALHVAVEKGDVETVKLLLNKSIDRDTRDNAGRTALDIAVSRSDKSIMDLLAR